MIVFKCKMCGGDLDLEPSSKIGTCQYCGSTQTLPKLESEKSANLYERANQLRRQNDFDKAASLYDSILAEDPSDAEAYWSLVLCKYGIEYVEDPATHKRIPTCNRTQFTSILADGDYKKALEHADSEQKTLYEQEAFQIDAIQKGILEISNKEEPFDIFICYKETDESGRRTQDSVLAQDMYHQLTNEGFKVFFARITLEDILGSAYEPYIFAALQSSKIMIVVGTKQEYFNAVWVKNEWSRYLSLIKGGAKKVLIPTYRDMDPYDLPEDFSHLQSQDMGKLGFMQDLIRGIKKLLGKDSRDQEVKQVAGTYNEGALLKRIGMFLADNDFSSADDYCSDILDINPDCTQVYFYKLFIDFKCNRDNRQYSQRLEASTTDISPIEAEFIAANTIDCCLAFIKGGAIQRLRYLVSQYPAVLTSSVSNENNPYISIVSYAILFASDIPENVAVLLDGGADPNSYRIYQNKYGQNKFPALSDALRKRSNYEIVKLLLAKGASVHDVVPIYFDDGATGTKTMLTFAIVDAGCQNLVNLLLENGADPKKLRKYASQNGSFEFSPLADSISNAKNYEMVKILLDNKADPNRVESGFFNGSVGKKSMLGYAITSPRSKDMVSLLLEYGAHWNSKIKLKGVSCKEAAYPYHKKFELDKDFSRFLSKNGWKGLHLWHRLKFWQKTVIVCVILYFLSQNLAGYVYFLLSYLGVVM